MIDGLIRLLEQKDVSVIGLLLVALAIMGWFYHKALKIIEKLRTELDNERKTHAETIQAINDKHKEEMKEMNKLVLDEVRKNGQAYKDVGEAFKMIMKSKPNE